MMHRAHHIPTQGSGQKPYSRFCPLQKFFPKKPNVSNLLDTYSCILMSTKG